MIHLSECTLLKTPPKEIVARGFVAVMGYLKRLRLGASPCKRTKLMLVGLGGAGKTRWASVYIGPDKQKNLKSKIENIFLSISLNICFGCPK